MVKAILQYVSCGSCSLHGDSVILEKTTPFKVKMSDHRIKAISQNNNVVFIYSDCLFF